MTAGAALYIRGDNTQGWLLEGRQFRFFLVLEAQLLLFPRFLFFSSSDHLTEIEASTSTLEALLGCTPASWRETMEDLRLSGQRTEVPKTENFPLKQSKHRWRALRLTRAIRLIELDLRLAESGLS